MILSVLLWFCYFSGVFLRFWAIFQAVLSVLCFLFYFEGCLICFVRLHNFSPQPLPSLIPLMSHNWPSCTRPLYSRASQYLCRFVFYPVFLVASTKGYITRAVIRQDVFRPNQKRRNQFSQKGKKRKTFVSINLRQKSGDLH